MSRLQGWLVIFVVALPVKPPALLTILSLAITIAILAISLYGDWLGDSRGSTLRGPKASTVELTNWQMLPFWTYRT